jgi:hypothetical protein
MTNEIYKEDGSYNKSKEFYKGLHFDTKVPQNLPKANAYSLLAEVRDSGKVVHYAGEPFISVKDLEKILTEHFS